MDRLHSVKETANILCTSRNKVYDLIKGGYLASVKIGSLKVPESSIDIFIQKGQGFDYSDLNNIKPLEVS